MTNAIEQAKREMYASLAHMKNFEKSGMTVGCDAFEIYLESYLELLRQDHEALHHTARARFEDTRKLEAANQELSAGLSKANENLTQAAIISRDSIASLEFRLAKMTEERDSIQLRLHAVDHAYKTQQDQVGTSGQVSGDRASCATPDAKTMALLGSILDVQRIVSDWAMGDSKAKASMHKIAAMVNGDLEVAKALDAFQNQPRCMHSFHPIPLSRNDKTEVCIYCWTKKECQHSFFAIGDDRMKCTYCSAEKDMPACVR